MSDGPRFGDSIWVSDSDWETDAILGNSPDWFICYALSYKATADTVVLRVEEKQIHPNVVGYAVCFLYRHYVEIMLKGLIRLGKILRDDKGDFPFEHSLYILWRECRPLVQESYPEGETSHTDAVEKCLMEFDALDPTGESFRFGEWTNGEAIFPNGKQINLVNLRDVMERLSKFLQDNYEWMDHLWTLKTDADNAP